MQIKNQNILKYADFLKEPWSNLKIVVDDEMRLASRSQKLAPLVRDKIAKEPE